MIIHYLSAAQDLATLVERLQASPRLTEGGYTARCPAHPSPERRLADLRALRATLTPPRAVDDAEAAVLLAEPVPELTITTTQDDRDRIVLVCTDAACVEAGTLGRVAEALEWELRECEATIEDLIEALPAAGSDVAAKRLEALLDPVLEAAARSPELARESYTDQIAKRTGVKRPVVARKMRATFARLKLKPDRTPAGGRAGGGERPKVRVTGRQESDLFAEVRRVFIDWNRTRIDDAGQRGLDRAELSPVFARAGQVVRLEVGRGAVPEIAPMGESAMYGYLARIADWLSETADGPVPAKPSKTAAADCLAMPDSRIGEIEAIATTPVFGVGGQLIDEPGYHSSAALWFHRDPALVVPPVPEAPTPEDISEAREWLLTEVLGDYRFAGKADLAHAVAAFLLPFARQMVHGPTPIHLVEAPTAGSGKTLLAHLVSVAVTGEECQPRPVPTRDDDMQKMITAELSRARAIILLDNLSDRMVLDSASLAAVITSTQWSDRILGESRMLTLPNRALWVMTANNPKLSEELVRRCVSIRIDPDTDRPGERKNWRHKEPIEWAQQNRAKLVHCALVLIRAWVAAGQPRKFWALPSFNGWASVMGGIVETAGIGGWLENRDKLREGADVGGDDWRRFVAAWWDAFKRPEPSGKVERTEPKEVSDLTQLCDKQGLMLATRGDGNDRSQQIRFGKALLGARDRVFRVDRDTEEVEYRVEVDGGLKSHGKRYLLKWMRRIEKPSPTGGAAGSGNVGNTRELGSGNIPSSQAAATAQEFGTSGNVGNVEVAGPCARARVQAQDEWGFPT